MWKRIAGLLLVALAAFAAWHYWPRCTLRIGVPPNAIAAAIPIDSTAEGGIRHFIGPFSGLHRPGGGDGDPFATVAVDIVIDPTGRVVAVTPVAGQRDAWSQAMAVAMAWRFIPFVRGGHAVYVKVSSAGVPLRPPERRGVTAVPFPHVRDWNTVRIALSRSGCYGSCPAYDVEVGGDGTVRYQGRGWVALSGAHRAAIPPEHVRALLERFRTADFFSLLDKYTASISDGSTQILTVSIDGRTKKVVDYMGADDGMPDVVTDLETAVDEAAGTARWTQGNAQTVPALVAEHFDCKSGDGDNALIVSRIARYGDAVALRGALALGCPALGSNEALSNAAERGDAAMVNILLAAGAGQDDTGRHAALAAAAENGDLAMVRALLPQGDAAALAPEPSGTTLLMLAARSGNPAVVREVLSRHPAVDMSDADGKTALMLAAATPWSEDPAQSGPRRAEIIALLVKAGADVNKHDNDGDGALARNYRSPAIARALLAAGADVNAQDRSGRTALMKSDDVALTRVLLAAGANASLYDNQGNSASGVLFALRFAWATDIWHALSGWAARHPITSWAPDVP